MDSKAPNYASSGRGVYGEIARQIFVLVAEQEFGLRVGDSSLGENPPPAIPPDRRFQIRGPRRIGDYEGWTVEVGLPNGDHRLWQGNALFRLNNKGFLKDLADYETKARARFRSCLVAAGFQPLPEAKASDAPVPEAVLPFLESMRETDQFAASRLLHAELRKHGESPKLLAALARAYANLAVLTEYQWSMVSNPLKARAFLFAQRLVAKSPKSATALWTRAYVAALCGMHNAALADLPAAAKLAAAEVPKPETPSWLELIDAFVNFDLSRLAAARKKSDSSLARLLEFLAAEAPEIPSATIRRGRAFLARDPECYRVHDSMTRTGGVSNLHGATRAWPAVYSRHFRERIREQPGLPDAVKKLLDDPDHDEAEIYSTLRRLGAAGQDSGEPSWGVLANLLQENRFVQAWKRLYFVAFQWGVPANEEAREFAKTLAGHPCASHIESFQFNLLREPEKALERLLRNPLDQADCRAMLYQRCLARMDGPKASDWYKACRQNTGSTYYDQSAMIRLLPANLQGRFSLNMDSVSRNSPFTISLWIERDDFLGQKHVPRFREYEERYSAHPIVLRSLSKYYQAQKKPEDAIRCWEKWIAASPDWEAFRDLAAAYLKKGDEKRWRETLESFLKEPDFGLNHAQAQVQLALYYMDRGQYKEASPYAQGAAVSGAYWALVAAAQCEAGLEHWKEATAIYRAAANRYPGKVFDWYHACRLHEQLDLKEAQQAVQSVLQRLPQLPGAEVAFEAGRYYQMTGDPKRASHYLGLASRQGASPLFVLHAALAAAEAGDLPQSFRVLESLGLRDLKQQPEVGTVIAFHGLLQKKGTASEQEAEQLIARLPANVQGNAHFYMGWYFKIHGRNDLAKQHWKQCLARLANRAIKIHARIMLKSGRPI